MQTTAIVLKQPEDLEFRDIPLPSPGADDVVVDVGWSGISTGTERLLYSGRMPAFPGMGYPLVPGYETVGRVADAGTESGHRVGAFVFVPGAQCFGDVHGLFGGSASRLVVPGRRVVEIDETLGERGVLMALAATAYHAVARGAALPELIVGHGVLGRLIARLCVIRGGSPTVWEHNPSRRPGADGYSVIAPDDDERRDYGTICDVSGDASLLDSLIARTARGGEIVLAGFYDNPVSFAFPPAFMRETRLQVAAEWAPADLTAVATLVRDGALSLDGLITHHQAASTAADAYKTAFDDPSCLKMVLDWSDVHEYAS